MKFEEIKNLDENGMPPYDKLEMESLLESGWIPPAFTELKEIDLGTFEGRRIYHYMQYSLLESHSPLEESIQEYKLELEELKKKYPDLGTGKYRMNN